MSIFKKRSKAAWPTKVGVKSLGVQCTQCGTPVDVATRIRPGVAIADPCGHEQTADELFGAP